MRRKAYGGGYAVMGSKQLSADLNFAWPTARIAVIGAEGAAQLLVKRFPDPTAPEVQKIRDDFIEGYNLNMATPWIAAERGYIDGVIQPHEPDDRRHRQFEPPDGPDADEEQRFLVIGRVGTRQQVAQQIKDEAAQGRADDRQR